MICLDKKGSAQLCGLSMDLTLEVACGISGGFVVLKSLRDRDLEKVGQLVQQSALAVFCSEVSFHYRHLGLKPIPLYGRVFLIGEALQISLQVGIKLTKLCFRMGDEDLELETYQERALRELKEMAYLSSQVALVTFAILVLAVAEGLLEHRRSFGDLDFL